MTWHAAATVAIILGAMVLFITEKVRIDLVALIALAAFATLGIVTPAQALAGFSNEATITVAAMFVLTLGIDRSGSLEPVARLLSRIRNPWLLSLGLMVVIAPLSAFVKNVALVATFLPLALRICARTGASPTRILLPMAYAAQMGGVGTLIGTSSNLLADSLARQQGLAGFSMFEFTKLGAVLTIAGIVYLMLIGRWMLNRESNLETPMIAEPGKYVAELRMTDDSPLRGQTIAAAKLGETYGIYPLELLRGDEHLWSPRTQELESGDALLVRGTWEQIEEFADRADFTIETGVRRTPAEKGRRRLFVEAMIAPASTLEGRTLSDPDLGWDPSASLLAISRRGQVLRKKPRDVQLRVGDMLMLLATPETIDRLHADNRLILLNEREDTRSNRRQGPIAIAIMLGVVAVSALGWMSIPIAAVVGAIMMAVTGCFGRKDVYSGIDWKIIILLGAILPMGTAIQNSGLSDMIVHHSMNALGSHGPLVGLLLVYLLTGLLTEFMGHNPSVVLMVGIAVSVAHAMNADPTPFVVAVAFAASTSFITPVGYPTNTMVYYAGGYRFTDFVKIGTPLFAMFTLLSMLLIPYWWPLTG